MRIVLGADHGGFALKEHVKETLKAGGHSVSDVGTSSAESTDYPQFAHDAAQMVADGDADMAVLACGSGNGVAIVANKVPGIRAVNAHDADEAELARRHNDANVVTLSGSRLDGAAADAIVEAFLAADFEGGRHQRRVDLIEHVQAR